MCFVRLSFSRSLLGAQFDIKDFHSVVLKNGGMSLNLLERNIDQWIAQVKSHSLNGQQHNPIIG